MTADARIAALPCWHGTPHAVPLPGGLSNEIWRIDDDAGAHVVRFGADYPFHHVDRAHEAMAARAAHAAGFAPAVEHTGPGVMVTAFVEGRTLTAADLAADPARFADLIGRFHTQMHDHVSGPARLFDVFYIVRDYARGLRAGDSPHVPDLPRLLNLSRSLAGQQPQHPIVFGHHDLLPANFIDDGTRLWLIDYEYAAHAASPLFDLASLAGHGTMTPDQSAHLLRRYHGTEPSPATVRAFDAMTCAALLREAMWAMVSDLHLAAPGADYGAYASENLIALDAAVARFEDRHGRLAP